MKKRILKFATLFILSAIFAVFLSVPASAALIEGLLPAEPAAGDAIAGNAEQNDTIVDDMLGGGAGSVDPNVTISLNGNSSDTVRIIVLLTILTVMPSILLMMTCFTRIVIVFSLLRNAMGLQQTPPNQVLIGLALFITFFVMSPIITDINDNAYKPYSEGDITTSEFLDRAKVPLRDFMLKQTTNDDINLFLNLANKERPATIEEYTMDIVVPAFITSEIKRAFTVGFMLFIPFLIIDMVVSSALMSMGMMMLPPVTISLPFKLMLFVLADGWGMLIRTVVSTYRL